MMRVAAAKTAMANPQMAQMATDKATDTADVQTHAIIGAAMDVHTQLGPGFLEAVYAEALSMEFETRRISFEKELELTVLDKKRPLRCTYRADFVCYDDIIVEIKALPAITGREHAQVINYPKATGYRRGLLLNFATPRLGVKRLVYDTHLCPSVKSVD